jgi:choice-of-anchor A domain-containing protein
MIRLPFIPARLIAAAGAAFLALGAGAQAAPLSAADLMGEYNLIVLGNATASSETEGTVYVGGNLTASGPYGVNPDGLANGSLGGTLVVGGDLNGEARLFSGDAAIGGAINGTLYNNGGGTVTQGASIDTAAVAAAALQLSADLAALSDTGGSITGGQNAVFNSVAGADGVAVFNITSAFFSGVSSLNFNTGGITTVINVTGANPFLGGGFNFNGSFPDVVFNFVDATNLTVSTAFGASILAPLADAVINGGRTQGSVVVGSLVQTVEIDGPLFDGDVPVSEVPLPAGAVLLLTGLAGLGAAKRRKRA